MLSTFFQFLSRILARTFHPAIEIISCFTLREREGLPARSHEPIDRSRRADVPVIDSSRREVEETLKEGLRSARQSLLIYHLVAAGSSLAFSIETPRGLVPVLPVNAIKSANGIAANGRSVIIQLRGTIYRHNSNLSKVDPLPPSPARKTDPNFRDKQQQCDCTRTSSAILRQPSLPVTLQTTTCELPLNALIALLRTPDLCVDHKISFSRSLLLWECLLSGKCSPFELTSCPMISDFASDSARTRCICEKI